MTTYVFEYRDEDGDDLIARPMRGIPAVMILTGTNGIAVDLDRVEEVVAGIRDAARQAAGQPATVVATLATPCDTCDHTLNWHDNQTGCILDRCACGRFREPEQPAAGQPDTQQQTETSTARAKLYAHLDPIPVPAVIRDALIDAYRAEVLRTAADDAERENHDCSSLGRCQPCATRRAVAAHLRRMADEAAQ